MRDGGLHGQWAVVVPHCQEPAGMPLSIRLSHYENDLQYRVREPCQLVGMMVHLDMAGADSAAVDANCTQVQAVCAADGTTSYCRHGRSQQQSR
jgi:hypothetical protein